MVEDKDYREKLKKWREEGSPWGKLFITHEEALDIRENIINERENEFKKIEKENEKIKEDLKNFDATNFIGKVLREFELKKKLNPEQKELINNLWNFVLKKRYKIIDIPKKEKTKQIQSKDKETVSKQLKKSLDKLKKIKELKEKQIKNLSKLEYELILIEQKEKKLKQKTGDEECQAQ